MRLTRSALSWAARAVPSCCQRCGPARTSRCSSCTAKTPAMSSRLAWMAAFTLDARSATSDLYLAFFLLQ